MVKIEFAEGWAEQFEGVGLRSFEDFFDYSAGRTINRNEKRDVTVMELSFGPQRKAFFMKRFLNPHLKDILFTFRNFGSVCSQAVCEWKNAGILLENGVQTYRPVCYGEQKILGVERRSFFITEKLKGECFTDFLARRWAGLERCEKEKIITELAGFVRRIHNAGVGLPDLYVWHLFIKQKKDNGTDSEYEFAVIDLHRMRINAGPAQRIRDLGALDFSMLDTYFDDEIRCMFLNSYLPEAPRSEKDDFWRSVKKRSSVLAGRRKRPRY
jgi:hypothetical protein